MSVQTDYDEIYAKRLAAIEKDPALTILSSMDQRRRRNTSSTPTTKQTARKPVSPSVCTRRLKMWTNTATRKLTSNPNCWLTLIVGHSGCTSPYWKHLVPKAA